MIVLINMTIVRNSIVYILFYFILNACCSSSCEKIDLGSFNKADPKNNMYQNGDLIKAFYKKRTLLNCCKNEVNVYVGKDYLTKDTVLIFDNSNTNIADTSICSSCRDYIFHPNNQSPLSIEVPSHFTYNEYNSSKYRVLFGKIDLIIDN
jgi:hypothetical protein